MYDVTRRSVSATIVALEKKEVCVFVALSIQHTVRICHIVICGVYGCTIFSHIISLPARISKKKIVTEHKMCFLIFSII